MRRILGILLLLGTSVSMAQIPSGYYDAAQGKSGADLKAALHNIIKGHTEYPYSSSSTDTWDILKETDVDPNNASNVIGLYSAFSMNAAAEYDGGNGWTREHVWAKSRGDFGTSLGAGTDVHHLRAEDASTNSARGNRNFDEATEQFIDGSGQYSGPTDSYTGGSGAFTWEPRDAVKGDVARMLFYMATRYEGEGGEPDLELTETLLSSTDNSPLHAKLSVLLTWHAQDPVDAYEQSRNDIIYGYQGNRNPFIDHPEYVASIWGGSTPSAPSFTSSPETSATEGVAYSYSITTSGGGGARTLSATSLPSWLTFTNSGNGNGNGNGILTGTPAAGDVGAHGVTLEVTDGSDVTTQSFTITVSAASGSGNATELLFSEYVEGSSYNKAVEIANFTGADVNLSGYVVKKQTNGSGAWSGGIALTGTIANGDVYVLAHSSASSAVLAQADFTSSGTELNFNGNDALSLHKDGVLIDAIGEFNSTATFGANVTLVRNAEVTSPNATYTISEWTSNASDYFGDLGSHTMNVTPPNSAPSVNITAPTNGATVTTGDAVNVTASASDSDGTVSTVEFFINGSSIGTDSSSPYQASFTAVEGSMSLTAVATDNDGTSTTSTAISITGETPVSTGVLYFSEYMEGSSNNKALEIANTSGSGVDMSGYVVKKQANGSGDWSGGLVLSGTLNDGAVYVLANSSANSDIISKADFTGGNSELTFNGNDAVGLFKDGVLIDILGTFNSATTYAQDITLRRNDPIHAPNDVYTTSEWTSHSTDNSSGLGLRYGESSGPSETLLSYDGFESGWGNFSDGGSDAYLSTNASRAFVGSGSAGIQDNTSSSVITYASSVDITGYDQVRIDFNFLPVSMENGEDFWVQIYNGSSYVTVASFTSGPDFTNNTFYAASVVVDPGIVNFASDMRVRFRCDASSNSDDVYLDEIFVTGINSSGARSTHETGSSLVELEVVSLHDSELVVSTDIEVYPNPVTRTLSFKLGEYDELHVQFIGINGAVLKKKTLSEDNSLMDVSDLESGVYLLSIQTSSGIHTRRIVKK